MLQNIIDWLRPVLFNLFVSRNVKASHFSTARSALEMDAVSLAVMTINILCFATAYGFDGSIDVYAPVAFGANHTLELNLVLYRQLLLLFFLMVITCSVLMQAESIFLALGQAPDVAHR